MSIERLGSTDPLSAYNKSQKISQVQNRAGKDTITVSEEARQKAELLRLDSQVRSTSDIRMDKVEEAKRKLEDPDYINSVVYDSVAGKLMGVFGIE